MDLATASATPGIAPISKVGRGPFGRSDSLPEGGHSRASASGQTRTAGTVVQSPIFSAANRLEVRREMSEARDTLDKLRRLARPAAIAEVGGFRPPTDPTCSWFCRAVGLPGEGLPTWRGEPMFPLLQLRMSELPIVPDALRGIELLVLFHNTREHPFDATHGEGWLIREYGSTQALVPLPQLDVPYRPFPVRWTLVADDCPGWEDAWSLVDLKAVNEDGAASHSFFHDLNRYPSTKVGGFPTEVQHGVGLDDYVFQVASEEKVGWMWADNGFGYFFRNSAGEWRWSCQFY